MRELLLWIFILCLSITALIRPKLGMYAIVWFSLMRPDVWAWASAQYPYASVLEAGTLLGCIKHLGQSGPMLRNPIVVGVLILQIPLALSVVFARQPELCYGPYWWYISCILSMIPIPLLIRTEEDFRRLVMVAALSIGSLGARFGLYGLIHGGARYSGGYGGSFADNNTLALALVMGFPLAWYGKSLIRWTPMRLGLGVWAFLTVAAVVFTHSRGAALSLAAVFLLILIYGRRRLLLLAGLIALTAPSVYMVRDSYFDRMETLRSAQVAQQDGSVMSRVEASRVAVAMWQDYPLLGVGFGSENERALWRHYAAASIGDTPLVIHDTYLQMLVDSGILALLIYALVLGGAIILMTRSTNRLKRAGSPLYQCSLAIDASLVAFAVGSTFLTRITFDFLYMLLMMAACWLIIEPEYLAALRERQEAEEEAGERTEQLLEAAT